MTSLPIQYYSRLQGEWSWTFLIEIRDSRALFRRPVSGLQILLIALWQRLAGPLQFWTDVSQVSPQGVRDKTRISKWGITLFKSIETIEFNQAHVVVSGKQSSWPLIFLKRPLGPFRGTITSRFTAEYQFEVLGYPCGFQGNFDVNGGGLSFKGPAIGGRFEFSDESKRRLCE